MEIALFILLLSFLVIIHEFGHFFVAKWCGIKVLEFGLGYPPKARTIGTWKGTPFTLNWIPFGGFVRLEGEDEQVVEGKVSAHSIAAKPAWQRLAVILAGAAVNFVFGVIAFAIVFSIMGIPHDLSTARIGYVKPGTPAEQAKVPVHVDIIKLSSGTDSIAQPTIEQTIAFIEAHRGQNISLTTTGPCQGTGCQEMAQEFTVYARSQAETPVGEGAMGIGFDEYVFVFYPWYEMPIRGSLFGTKQALVLGVQIIDGLKQAIVTGFTQRVLPSELSGPVGIVHEAQKSQVFKQGWLAILGFTGMLSVNLAIMNVLPIPALDGGRAIMILFEPIIGRKRLQNYEGYIHYGGFVVLVTLIVVITARDILRIFYGS